MMEHLQFLEAVAKSGILALVLSLIAVRYQTRELEKVRQKHAEDEKACADRLERLQNAMQALMKNV